MDYYGKRTSVTRLFFVLIFTLFSLTLSLIPVSAQTGSLPANFTNTAYVGDLTSPTAMAFAPDGRLFIAEQGGDLRVAQNGSLLTTPFVSLDVHNTGERGLLGVTVDPNFATNGYVYVYYTTNSSPRHNRVSRFTANGNVAEPGSEVPLMDLPDLSGATNHNGGALHFGPDGMLYIAVGEDANGSLAQDLNSVMGSILRINPDGSIPTNNPFYGSTTGDNRSIWAYGLRNPFTFAFQPGTGTMYINDVGEGTWEEINQGQAGANYGWPTTEGETTNPDFVSPLYVYPHSGGSVTDRGCSIAGAAFYNPTNVQFPAEYVGDFFFADYCNNWIKHYDPNTDTATLFASDLPSSIVDIRVQPDGNLYYLSRGWGSVFVVQYNSMEPPTIIQQPSNTTVDVSATAQFMCGASGATPLSYQWQRGTQDISGATSSTLTLQNVALTDNGATFRCVVTNSFGSATSNAATLTVRENHPPTVMITAPIAGTRFIAGDTIAYAGTATDPEDGALPASSYTWRVDLHHDEHTHPQIAPFSGQTSGTFDIPTEGHSEYNIWYRLHLTAIDSSGSQASTYVDILPNHITLTVTTSPPGLSINLDGQPHNAPYSTTAVAGVQRELSAPLTQMVGSTLYALWGWSDAGAATHTISTPVADTTYTAIYTEVSSEDGFSITPPPNATIDLGAGVINTARVAYLQVVNNSDTAVTIESAQISGADAAVFSVSGIPTTIGSSSPLAQLPVSCTPTEAKAFTATLILHTTDSGSATITYALTCAGVAEQVTAPNAPQDLTANPNQGRPTLTWRNDSRASWYNLWIGGAVGTLHYQWYPVNPADEFREGISLAPIECSGLTCTLKPDINPTSGTYAVWMQSWGNGGYSTGGVTEYDGWATTEFSLPADAPGAISGITATAANNGGVNIQWQGASNATWYNVWLGTAPDEWEVHFFDWVLAEDLTCENGGQCDLVPGTPVFSNETYDVSLTSDDYVVYVRAWGPGGFDPGGIDSSGWYAGEVFTIP